ncbi:MAG: dihydropteroate synthase [Kiloniellaceae bacterium]
MTGKLTLRPLGIGGPAVGAAEGLPLAGGPLAFTACEAVLRDDGTEIARQVVPLTQVVDWAERCGPGMAAAAETWLERLRARRAPFAGITFDRPQVMGVINVTPDSFSDGGDRFDTGKAIADGLAMLEAGAAVLDVGGESTRPGADPVGEAEELRRVIPVVRALAEGGALVSIDTCHARVMAEALAAGARIVNDVTALVGDPRSLSVAAEAEVPVVLMHMQGDPRTMQVDPTYDDAPLDVFDFLAARVEACEAAGIRRARVAVDPGIGFGKTLDHNLQILDQLALYQGLGCPVLLGVSRKSFISRLSRGEPPKGRVPGSLAAAIAGLERGVQIIRAHDVAETVQAITIWRAITAAEAVDTVATA